MSDQRQPTGFALRDPFHRNDFVSLARLGEQLRYRAVFLPEISGRDSFAALSALAGETRELLLCTGIVPMTSRPVRLTAMAAATVHDASGGRHVLGLGTGPAGPGAIERLREQVRVLRLLLTGAEAEHEGRRLRVSLDPGSPVPIWVSALGPRAVELAGEVADGVILNWCTPERVAEARRAIRGAAERAARDPDEVTVAVYVRGALGGEGDVARRAILAATVEYATYPAYARQFEAMGLGEQARAAAAGESSALADAVCLPGGADAAREALRAFRDAGADLPIVYPVAFGEDLPGSVAGTLRALAP